MAVIRRLSIKNIYQKKMKEVKEADEKAHGRKFSMREIKEKMTTNA